MSNEKGRGGGQSLIGFTLGALLIIAGLTEVVNKRHLSVAFGYGLLMLVGGLELLATEYGAKRSAYYYPIIAVVCFLVLLFCLR